jgi:hypothetical protein
MQIIQSRLTVRKLSLIITILAACLAAAALNGCNTIIQGTHGAAQDTTAFAQWIERHTRQQDAGTIERPAEDRQGGQQGER